MYNFIWQNLDDIAINLQFSRNFAIMKYIRRICNLMVDFQNLPLIKRYWVRL